MSVSNIKIGAVLVGWITSLFLLFAIVVMAVGIILAFGLDYESMSQKASEFTIISFALFIYLSMFMCFFTGGYVAGRMAAYSGILNGAMTIVLNIIMLALVYIFIAIVGKKLNIDIISPILQVIEPYRFSILIITIMAIAGSILGGRFGEGYVDRLDQALGITDPSARTKKNISAKIMELRHFATRQFGETDDSETSNDRQVS